LKIQIVLWAALAGSMMASPITLTISTTAGGTIGNTALGDNTVTFTQITDTTSSGSCLNAITCPGALNTNTVTISGVGTYTITDSTYFFDNAAGAAGFYDNTLGETLADVFDGAFSSYTFQTALGPIFNSGGADLTNIPTSGGALTLTGNSLDATFQAVMGTSSAPEPGTLGLILIGALGLRALRSKTNFSSGFRSF
jgi:hypothetical protein